MPTRKTISPSVEADVLTRSRRRCCICFGLHHDDEVTAGQIAHLDADASNNTPSNLAFLCFDHHNEYDSLTRQSKGLTKAEVKEYRKQLYTHNDRRAAKCELRLEIDRDYDQFTDTELDALMKAITSLSGVGDGVRVINKRRGSVVVRLELMVEQARAILAAVKDGKLDHHRVLKASLLKPRDTAVRDDEFSKNVLAAGTAIRTPSTRGAHIYVGNLNYSTTSQLLEDLFSQFGEVIRATVVINRKTGRSRGFALVEMGSGADEAIEALNDSEIKGRTLTVQEVRPRADIRSNRGNRRS